MHLIQAFSSLENIHAYFAGRLGGLSVPPYDSLNTGHGIGDCERTVERNRHLLYQHVNSPSPIATLKQVHGNQAFFGAEASQAPPLLEGDALIVDPGTTLMMFGADCPLVFLAAPRQGFVALAHAGWRGLEKGVVSATVSKLRAHDCRPEGMTAFISPSIGPCCFEVGEEVLETFGSRAVPGDKPTHLDLGEMIRRELLTLGLPPTAIERHPDCTRCRRDLYFSYRGDGGTTGRNTGLLWSVA